VIALLIEKERTLSKTPPKEFFVVSAISLTISFQRESIFLIQFHRPFQSPSASKSDHVV
jgi:hypothetical protein